MADKNIYSTIEAGLSNAYFMGRDLPFHANRALSPGFSLSVMTRQHPRISNGFSFTMNFPTSKSIGRLDSISDYTFVYYQTRIHRYDFFLKTDLIKHKARYQKRPDFIPYLYTGIGWMKFKQFVRYGYEDKVTVQNKTGMKYDKRSLALPIGIGMRFKLSKQLDLSYEILYTPVFSNQFDLDYLNGFSYGSGRDSFITMNVKVGII